MTDMLCPKCRARSGDDWGQCRGSCPMPGSPHYDPSLEPTVESLECLTDELRPPMTDKVNVPREALQRLGRLLRLTGVPSCHPEMVAINRYLAAAPKAEPVDAEEYLKEAISSSPQPLQDLGAFLSSVLDEDHWKTADRLLLAIATSRPEAPKAEQEPDGWQIIEAADDHLTLRDEDTDREAVVDMAAILNPAPASDELLEALEAVRKELIPCGVLNDNVRNALTIADRAIAKRKGPRP